MNDFPTHDDEKMRELLGDAVSDVEPRESLDRIRARTTVTPLHSRRPWIWGAGAAVVATAATVTAVAVIGNGPSPNAADPGFATGPSSTPASSEGPSAPSSTPPPTQATTQATTQAPTKALPVYYLGDTDYGPRLFREFHPGPADTAVLAAVTEAVGRRPADPDYRVPWPKGTTVAAAGPDDAGDLITVDLRGPDGTSLRDRPAGMDAEEASLAVEQLIYTAQAAAQTRSPVQLLLDGRHTDTVLGVPTAEPLSQGDPADVLAQVWIIDPAEGSRVRGPITVTGLANAFEANVQWELKQGDTVVKRGYTMAREAFTMAPYSFTVAAPPGQYTLVVHDEDASGGAEGAGVWQDTKSVTIVK